MAVPKALCNFREIVGVEEHFFVINEPFSIVPLLCKHKFLVWFACVKEKSCSGMANSVH